MPTKGLCSDCRHSGVIMQFGSSQLVCQYRPPKVVALPTAQGGIQLTGTYPPVERTWKCSKWAVDETMQ